MTFNDLIQKVIIRLSQVPGTAVQLYSEDKIAAILQEKFDIFYDELWWPQFMEFFSRTLDGSTGTVSVNIDTITSYGDIRAIFRGTTDALIPILPSNINPYRVTGDRVYHTSYNDTTKHFQIWPLTSTGDVVIHASVKPDAFATEDTVDFDEVLLVNAACWAAAEDDGTNPGATQRFQSITEARLEQLRGILNSQPIALSNTQSSYPTDWYVKS